MIFKNKAIGELNDFLIELAKTSDTLGKAKGPERFKLRRKLESVVSLIPSRELINR